ncbi:MAG TPA: class I SAM-dependent methyltransferase [Thermotogota bacterium]|nr:class I SAM-dependent methyltransferase [Thermotogota bacterium]
MNRETDKWNAAYKNSLNTPPSYDDWLNKHMAILQESKDYPIIDLGCGKGNNTLYLSEREFSVIACDFSEEALSLLQKHIPAAETRCFDFSDGLPFPDHYTPIIIADLSLHYFPWRQTNGITGEIFRVLKPGGYLFCRLNSVKDTNHGAGCGELLEENFYRHNGHCKRFFNREQIEELFKAKKIRNMEEYSIDRYTHRKMLWEVIVQNLSVNG